jgi:alkane 1-monooxygenase
MGWGWTVPISGKHPDLAARIGQFYQHYGLTRKHLGKVKYEHVQTRLSLSNFENYTEANAPQLTYGYPIMTMAAMYSPFFRRIMNSRLRKWREIYYPEITDWSAYNSAKSSMPR